MAGFHWKAGGGSTASPNRRRCLPMWRRYTSSTPLTASSPYNSTIWLPHRGAVGQRACPALFLSLHFNWGASSRGSAGVETCCLAPAGLPSSLRGDYEDPPQHVFPNSPCDGQTFHLALRLHRSVVQ